MADGKTKQMGLFEKMPSIYAQLAGINAAIQQALQAAGITTFAHLAEADLAKLRQILQEAGLPAGDLETWLEQARLAASGDWQALAEWKERYAAGEGAA